MDTIEVIKNWIDKESQVLDLGCGDGNILNILTKELGVTALGVEINQENLNECINLGLNVIQQNIDEGLSNFSNKSFDVVIMSQTIQVLKEPKQALLEVTRIGKESIVTIPNFGHWATRLNLLLSGRMPVTGALPNNWYDTENIHLCTIKDFEVLCSECGIDILEKRFFNGSGKEKGLTQIVPNAFAATAIYKISK
ncbi:MAG: methionine biosynthesis protein MetW [Gammaproteobacteria bacterium]|nr:methionine biosynthesis protein MetW [Gammaproteobacteria bacterium]RZP02322.1 MAG: methionine biosynthesis protein MetW [Gammaproteobacteria bacterium]|tara:strand:- start:313 stop:900 length:588 start_codon:yes stop_codon:yes gene_type:complete